MRWLSYNQSFVIRCKILLGFVINNWLAELKKMSKKTRLGLEPFHHANTFLLLLGYANIYSHLPYRQTEGIAQGHSKGKLPSISDFTTINIDG
jgi:hypothetical protein